LGLVCEVIRLVTFLRVLHPVPEVARSEACVCGRSLAGIAVSNPAGGMDICCGCYVLPVSLCVGLITRPVKSNRLCVLSVILKP
jgi:hypothetical protein